MDDQGRVLQVSEAEAEAEALELSQSSWSLGRECVGTVGREGGV